ncbi:hypothetical protein ABEB36_007962 [Hypothenemus hampei]|uniref:Uncharacterized protein n=1 Tax=Hypothenemus hampei TaxID=57062 RepID=A0ABD1EVS4_HYPHA
MDGLDQELDAVESLYFQLTSNKVLNSENQNISEIDDLSFIEKSCADLEDAQYVESMLLKCNSKIPNHTRFENLQSYINTNGLGPRKHKLAGRKSTRKNIITAEMEFNAIQFIKTFAEKNSIPLPGRMPNFKDYCVMKLLSSECKASIYRKFAASFQDGQYVMGERSFVNLWEKYVPYITTMRPASDLCDRCRSNSLSIYETANLTTEEKT